MGPVKRRIMAISGETVIPISFLGAVFSAAYWINGLSSRVDATEQRVSVYDQAQAQFEDFSREHLEGLSRDLGEIKAQVAALDARLDLLIKLNKKHD